MIGRFALIFFVFFTIYWVYPRVTRRTLNRPMAYLHFIITLLGAYALIWPIRYAGLAGMPRRYIDYTDWVGSKGLPGVSVMENRAIVLLICAQVILVINLIYSAVKGPKWA